jgi:hypothetical protein
MAQCLLQARTPWLHKCTYLHPKKQADFRDQCTQAVIFCNCCPIF